MCFWQNPCILPPRCEALRAFLRSRIRWLSPIFRRLPLCPSAGRWTAIQQRCLVPLPFGGCPPRLRSRIVSPPRHCLCVWRYRTSRSYIRRLSPTPCCSLGMASDPRILPLRGICLQPRMLLAKASWQNALRRPTVATPNMCGSHRGASGCSSPSTTPARL